ncbi:MAG: PKD domain-containing protein [Bacteroidota bacterium]|nr:PKD domain-containing protein [Bacteroidota bacterium]
MKVLFTLFITLCIHTITCASGHVVTVSSSINETCPGTCDGQATVSVSGGTGSFAFSWLPSGGTDSIAVNLCAGSYTVTVTDSSDMSTATVTVTISQPVAPVISLSPSYFMCHGDSVSLVTTIDGGGANGYFLNWSPFAWMNSNTVLSPKCSPDITTTYTITIVDSVGCTYSAFTTVDVNPLLTIATSVSNPTSCGICDGSATVTPTGGTAPYFYSWVGGITTQINSGLCPGTYQVDVVDLNGCTIAASAIINEQQSANHANFTMVPDSASANTFWAFNTSGGNGITYSWDFGDGGSSTLFNPTHTYAISGVYNVCLIVSSASSCNDTLCQSVTASGVTNQCLALFNIASDTTSQNAFTLYNFSYGTSLSYLWDFGDSSTSTLSNPTHTYSSGSGSYEICLTVNNGNGCTSTYCDSIFSVDSLGRTNNLLSLTVIDVPYGVLTTTGLSSNSSENRIDIYPNPFTTITIVKIQTDQLNEIYSFEMLDELGKTVKVISGITGNEFSISHDGLKGGIYFYKIYSSKKFIKAGKLVAE